MKGRGELEVNEGRPETGDSKTIGSNLIGKLAKAPSSFA
jgi:hypothetical protein